MTQSDSHLGELRLLLEELCCDLCRFEHVTRDGLAPETIRIDREHWLGVPGAFADIRSAPAYRPPYFVEVKFGYSAEMLRAPPHAQVRQSPSHGIEWLKNRAGCRSRP